MIGPDGDTIQGYFLNVFFIYILYFYIISHSSTVLLVDCSPTNISYPVVPFISII